VMRHPKLHLEKDLRGEMTELGGLVLPQQFVRRFRVAQRIDAALNLFKRRVPYHESDHVLALAYTLYADGKCLEDQATLQGSEAIRRMLGACRIPDPTTAGDFLRRFDKSDVATLADTMDDVQEDVWTRLSRRERRRRRQRELALVDLDGHIKEIYGSQKEGADFSYDGRWSYQPLVISLAGSGECLRVVNQPGNARSSEAAAGALAEVLPRVKRHFRNAIVRGDSDFDRSDVFNAVIETGAYFAIVGRMHANRAALVQAIAEKDWHEFVPRAQREVISVTSRRESSTPDYREQKVSEHGWKNMRTKGQWISEIVYHPAGVAEALRMIVRRVLIEEDDGQGTLFEHYRYRIILTSLPRHHTPRQIADLTYQRCDQENVIAEFGSGIAGWRMPVAQFWGNSAWLEIARLAWNLGKWIAQLSLPAEVVRWEWKRFRRHFVYVAAKVLSEGREILVRLSGSHRRLPDLLAAHVRLQA
jgi:DDE family transposase